MADTLQLRPLQQAAIDAVAAAFRAGHKNVLLQAPCSFGKTELATAMLLATHANGRRGVFVCDRLSLIEQTSARFTKYGLAHGIIQGANTRGGYERIQLCSIQTLHSRGWPETQLTIADEAHVLPKALTERIARRDGYTVGLTATPFTKGMGKYFDVVINATTTNKLIADGWLTPYRTFAPSTPDMTDVPVAANGEWEEGEAEKKMLPIVGDCVAEYAKHGDGKKFIVFATSVTHAEELKRQFAAAGVVTELYTYKQGDVERTATVAEFRKPDSYIRGLISIEALTRGFDVPDIEVLILARPLRKALAVHIQMIGRVMRISPETGKSLATILDHSGNTVRFWNETTQFFEHGIDRLDDGKPKAKGKAVEKEKSAMTCPSCHFVHDPMPSCPQCGHLYTRAQVVQHQAGTLAEVRPAASRDDRRQFYAELVAIAGERGYMDGWIANKYREKFNVWPQGMKGTLPARRVRNETRNWLRSRAIAYAKGKQARFA